MDDTLVVKTLSLVQRAEGLGITLRVGGSIGVLLHSPEHARLMDVFQSPPRDIDLFGLSTQRQKIVKLLVAEGFSNARTALAAIPYMERDLFVAVINGKRVLCDVYYNCASFVHPIDLHNRLALDYPTLTVTDLLMMKLQMRRRAVKDMVHEVMLLNSHPLLAEEGDCINQRLLCERVRNDLRCYRTFIASLGALAHWATRQLAIRVRELAEETVRKCRSLETVINRSEKGIKWELERLVEFALPNPPEPEELGPADLE